MQEGSWLVRARRKRVEPSNSLSADPYDAGLVCARRALTLQTQRREGASKRLGRPQRMGRCRQPGLLPSAFPGFCRGQRLGRRSQESGQANTGKAPGARHGPLFSTKRTGCVCRKRAACASKTLLGAFPIFALYKHIVTKRQSWPLRQAVAQPKEQELPWVHQAGNRDPDGFSRNGEARA